MWNDERREFINTIVKSTLRVIFETVTTFLAVANNPNDLRYCISHTFSRTSGGNIFPPSCEKCYNFGMKGSFFLAQLNCLQARILLHKIFKKKNRKKQNRGREKNVEQRRGVGY